MPVGLVTEHGRGVSAPEGAWHPLGILAIADELTVLVVYPHVRCEVYFLRIRFFAQEARVVPGPGVHCACVPRQAVLASEGLFTNLALELAFRHLGGVPAAYTRLISDLTFAGGTETYNALW